MFRRIAALALLMIFLLSACQPNITVSSDPKDADLSAFHPEVVRGPGFTLQPDVRVFALFAFLNGPAGWTEENGKSFTPQREQLRAELKQVLDRLDPKTVKRWSDFYQQHKVISYQYLYYVMTLGAPPQFNYIVPVAEMKYANIIGQLDGFNKILADFYQQTNLQALFEKTYREQMLAEIRRYDQQRILSQVDAVYRYLRLDRAQAETFDVVIVPAPFDSHWDANALNYTRRLVIVEGPESNDYGLNTHEYLHMLMDDLIPSDLAGQQGKLDAIFQANRKANYVKSYQNLHTYVEENLVRALDHRLRGQLEPNRLANEERTLRDEVANGLVLEDNFYQALEPYEKNTGLSAKDFFSQMLRDVKE